MRHVGLALLALALAAPALAHHSELHDWLLGWIPTRCCVTNNCCWEIQLSDIEPVANDTYKIKASGQVVKRTDWSPDGRLYRCACELVEGVWTVFPTANTRCLFIPALGS